MLAIKINARLAKDYNNGRHTPVSSSIARALHTVQSSLKVHPSASSCYTNSIWCQQPLHEAWFSEESFWSIASMFEEKGLGRFVMMSENDYFLRTQSRYRLRYGGTSGILWMRLAEPLIQRTLEHSLHEVGLHVHSNSFSVLSVNWLISTSLKTLLEILINFEYIS